MTYDYAKFADVASNILGRFGQDVTFRNVVGGVYDPATGTVSSTTTDTTRKGALFDFAAGQTLGPGGLIQGGDKKLLLEAGSIPALEDHILVGGITYVIKGIGENNPAGTPVVYTLHLRRG